MLVLTFKFEYKIALKMLLNFFLIPENMTSAPSSTRIISNQNRVTSTSICVSTKTHRPSFPIFACVGLWRISLNQVHISFLEKISPLPVAQARTTDTHTHPCIIVTSIPPAEITDDNRKLSYWYCWSFISILLWRSVSNKWRFGKNSRIRRDVARRIWKRTRKMINLLKHIGHETATGRRKDAQPL